MVIENSKNHTPVNINVNGIQLEQVDQYRYLGVLITRDGRDENEIKCRIARARNTFNNLAIVLCDKRMNLQLRLRILRCYVWPLLKYAAETWTFKKALENKVNAFELWCYRRMLRIHRSDRVRNEEVLNRIGLGERILFESVIDEEPICEKTLGKWPVQTRLSREDTRKSTEKKTYVERM